MTQQTDRAPLLSLCDEAEPTQAALRAAMIARAAKRGLRVAAKWEVEMLGLDQLFKSNLGGPVFVKVADHGPGDES